MDNSTRKNLILFWISGALVAITNTLTSTSVLSGYLLYIGLDEQRISNYLALLPLVNLVISLLCSGITSKLKKTIRAYSLFCLALGVVHAAYALLFYLMGNTAAFYPILLVFGTILSVATALKTIFDYRLPCDIMDLSYYSRHLAVSGIIGGITGIGSGIVLRTCYDHFDFRIVTCLSFLIGGILIVIASLISLRMKSMNQLPADEKDQSGIRGLITVMKDLFGNRYFRLLFVPNTIRGIGNGVLSVITVLAVKNLSLAESDGAIIGICTNIGNLVSYALYGFLAPRLKAPKTGIWGAIGFCLLIPSLMFGRFGFFVLYVLAYVGFNVMGCAIPDMIYQNIPADIMAPFHTWRLALMTLGTTITTALLGGLMQVMPAYLIFLIGAVTTVMCAVAYYVLFRKSKGVVSAK